MSSRFALVALVGVSSLAACGGDSSEAGDHERFGGPSGVLPESASVQDIPVDQMRALEDGKVTLLEYNEAFSAFERCVVAGGQQLYDVERSPVSGYISFGTLDELPTPENPDVTTLVGSCYDASFDWVDYVFQTTDPAVLDEIRLTNMAFFDKDVRPCLEKNQIAVSNDIEPGSSEFVELVSEWQEFVKSGSC